MVEVVRFLICFREITFGRNISYTLSSQSLQADNREEYSVSSQSLPATFCSSYYLLTKYLQILYLVSLLRASLNKLHRSTVFKIRVEDFTTVKTNSKVFSFMTFYRSLLGGYRRFGETRCFYVSC